jgi:mannose-1-phosphate guanylyltransferase
LEDSDNIYFVVTADGGTGDLPELTRALHGKEVPKALAMITSKGSLLQQTVATFCAALGPRSVFALVSEPDEEAARSQLEAWSNVEVVGVPRGCGGACALLLVVGEILLESPHAEIVVVSAECYLANPQPFIASVPRARAQLGLAPAVLLGVAATDVTPGRRWLVPGVPLGEEVFGLRDARVPTSEDDCTTLIEQRAMWNTSAFVARGPFLIRALTRAMPLQVEAIARAWQAGRFSPTDVGNVLAALPRGSCAIDVDALMMREIGAIAVARVEGAGWSDWRSSEEVLRSLSSQSERAWLSSRLDASSAGPAGQQRPARDFAPTPPLAR